MADVLPTVKGVLYQLARWRNRLRMPRNHRYVSFEEFLVGGEGAPHLEAPSVSDLAAIQYTGGTTGDPKGVMLSHANLYINTWQVNRWFTHAEPGTERVLAILPFAHAFGMTAVMNFTLSFGGELIVLPQFDLPEMLGAIERRRATMLIGVPALFRAINDHPRLWRYDLSSLKVAISGGDALPREVQEAFERATGCPLAEGYGLTDARQSSPVTILSSGLRDQDLAACRYRTQSSRLLHSRTARRQSRRRTRRDLRQWSSGDARLLEETRRDECVPRPRSASYR